MMKSFLAARSWPETSSKRFFLLLGLLAAMGPAGMDIYNPALPTMAFDLGVSMSASQLTVSLYLAGLATGQLLFGYLSDVYGRRLPLLVGLVLFVAASVLCALAPSLATLVVCRLVQGAAAASGIVIGRSVVRDLFDLEQSARYYSRLVVIYGVAPIVAPLIGAQVLTFASWEATFLVVGGGGALLLVAAALWFPETLLAGRRRSGSFSTTWSTFGTLLRHRKFLGCLLTITLMTGVVLVYVASAAFVMQDGYGASPQLFAVLFGLNALAMVAGNQANSHLVHHYSPHTLIATGLILFVGGSIALMVVAAGDLGLLALEVCLSGILGSWGLIQGNVLAISLADHPPQVAGAGSALIGFATFGFGALLAPLSGLGEQGSAISFAAISLCLAIVGSTTAYLMVLRGLGDVALEPEPVEVI